MILNIFHLIFGRTSKNLSFRVLSFSDQETPETLPLFPAAADDVDPYSVSDWLNLGFQFSHTDIDQSTLLCNYVSGADQSEYFLWSYHLSFLGVLSSGERIQC